jgi:acetylornithine/N-succinyldiaminopimelate aminotransferase
MNVIHILPTHLIAPVEITRAAGLHMYDRDGGAYVDFEAGMWCMALGYDHPRISACLAEQAAKVMHLGPLFSNSLTERAAEALLRHTPHPDGQALFLSSGSEAVEMGIRLARMVTNRQPLLAIQGSYLGAFGAAVQSPGTGWTHVNLAPCQACDHASCTAGCPVLRDLDISQFAAFVLEPVLASGGIRVPPSAPIRDLAAAVQGAGGLVVVDEVTSGLGRTGTWWGYEQHGIVPDVIACGKGLGNGYPVSAVAVSAPVAAAIGRTGFRYAQSHQNDPMAAAIAFEVLSVLADEGLVERAAAIGPLLGQALHALKAEHPEQVVEARGIGLMWALEVKPGIAETVWERTLLRGYYLGIKSPLSLLRFMPPLTVTPATIEAMTAVLGEELQRVAGE